MHSRLLGRAATAAALTVLAAGLAVTATAGPAQADDRILTPTDGAVVAYGYTGPFTIDMTGAPAATYQSTIDCRDQEGHTAFSERLDDIVWDGSADPVRTLTSPVPLTQNDSPLCGWDVINMIDASTFWRAGFTSFTVADPPPPPAPVITAPAKDGAVVPDEFTGPFRVDMTRAPAGTYTAGVQCAAGQIDFDERFPNFTWDGGTDPVRSFKTSRELSTHPNCFFDVYRTPWVSGEDNPQDIRYFAVDNPPVEITASAPDADPFYPLVHDGYRDTTTIGYRVYNRDDATVTARVLNSAGRVVKQAGLGNTKAGRHTWTWNGRDKQNARVPSGGYRIQLTAKDARGNTDTVTKPVAVATAVVTRTGTKTVSGSTGIRSASGGCSVTRDSTAMELDCWGGRYARAAYRFSVPASSTGFSYQVSGRAPDSDICCDGRITKTASRPAKTSYVVTTQVTGWRAYTVERVTATWKYRARI